jgi:hypothetical protein
VSPDEESTTSDETPSAPDERMSSNDETRKDQEAPPTISSEDLTVGTPEWKKAVRAEVQERGKRLVGAVLEGLKKGVRREQGKNSES